MCPDAKEVEVVAEDFDEFKDSDQSGGILKDFDILVDGESLIGGSRPEFFDMFTAHVLFRLDLLTEQDIVEAEFYEHPPDKIKIRSVESNVLEVEALSFRDESSLNPEFEGGVLIDKDDLEQEFLSLAETISEEVYRPGTESKEQIDSAIDKLK